MRKSAAPPPPPPSRPLSVSSFADDSDSMSVESLDGRVKLNIVLPNGAVVPLEVERRTAMMDLLVHVTKANNLNPASHLLDVKNDNRDSVRYKPNAPIGSLDAATVHVIAKSPPHDVESRIVVKPFEKTFRLRVHLPRNQLHVMRVSPQMPLTDIFNTICTERGLTSTRYEVRHPIHTEMKLNLTCCLADYNLSEIALMATKDCNSSGSSIHSDTENVVTRPDEGRKKHGILNFMFKKTRSSTNVDIIGDDRNKSATLPGNNGPPHQAMSPASSMPSISNINIAANKASKKRQAPPPPPSLRSKSSQSLQQKTSTSEDAEDIREGVTFSSHSRHSSDSSGYHEASILSDSPETNGPDVDTSNYKENVVQRTNINHTDSTSTVSVSTAGIKKRKAPPPPPLTGSHCSQTSKSTSPLSPHFEISPGNHQHGDENGHKEEYHLCHNDRLSRKLSFDSEEQQSEQLPVPKPRHLKVTNSEQLSLEDAISNSLDSDCTTVVMEYNNNVAKNANNEELRNSYEKLSQLEDAYNTKVMGNEYISTSSIELDERDSTNNRLDGRSELPESHAQLHEALELKNGSDHSVNSRNNSMNSEMNENDADVLSRKQKAETINRHSASNTDIRNAVMETGSAENEELNEVASQTKRTYQISDDSLHTEYTSVVTCDDTINTYDKEEEETTGEDHLPSETNDQLSHSMHHSSPSTKSKSEEAELAAAINEFHNESNTTKQHLADLWSHMIALPTNNHEPDGDSTPSDNDDELSVNEEHFCQDENDVQPIHVLESEPLEETNKDVCNQHLNGTSTDDTLVEHHQPSKDIIDDTNTPCDARTKSPSDKDSIHDPVVTWEYKIPDVPHAFRDDTNEHPSNEEASIMIAHCNEINGVSSTSTDKKEKDNMTDRDDTTRENVQLRQIRPNVLFSISTYRNRIEEETSYEDKLVRTDSFSSTPTFEFSKTTVSKSATSKPVRQEEITKKESVPGQASAITTAIISNGSTSDMEGNTGEANKRLTLKKAQSEMQLNLRSEGSSESVPLTEHEKLQEEYMKLHQQFIQWQKQLLNNQTVLQNQQILPDSTTDALKPLQKFQQQFTSLPPVKTFQKQSTIQSEAKTNSLPHSQSIDSLHSSQLNQSTIEQRNIIYGPRPWRPVSISSWSQQPQFTTGDKETDSPTEAMMLLSLDTKSGDDSHLRSKKAHGNNDDDTRTRQPYKERIASFNIGTFQKPTIKINRQASHAAAFPRYPVVRGFSSTAPQQVSKTAAEPLNTAFSNGSSNVISRQSSHTSQAAGWKSNSLPPQKQTNRQSGKSMTYFGDVDAASYHRHEDFNSKSDTGNPSMKNHNNSVVSRTDAPTLHSSSNNKFTTVINVGRENHKQQEQGALRPAVPQQQKRNESGDTRNDLMSAIRDFGGRHGLKKVSSVETRWQERHGNVN